MVILPFFSSHISVSVNNDDWSTTGYYLWDCAPFLLSTHPSTDGKGGETAIPLGRHYLSLLRYSNLPSCFWHYGFMAAMFLYSRSPTRLFGGKLSLEAFFKREPEYLNYASSGVRRI